MTDEAHRKMVERINQALARVMGPVKYKGTSTYYYAGTIGTRSTCYTLRKTTYNGKWGFWSWIQVRYKNGTAKRFRFAKSASGKKAHARAVRLFKQMREKYQILEERDVELQCPVCKRVGNNFLDEGWLVCKCGHSIREAENE